MMDIYFLTQICLKYLFYVLDYIFYIELKIGHVQLNAEHQTLIMKLIPWYKNTTRVC